MSSPEPSKPEQRGQFTLIWLRSAVVWIRRVWRHRTFIRLRRLVIIIPLNVYALYLHLGESSSLLIRCLSSNLNLIVKPLIVIGLLATVHEIYVCAQETRVFLYRYAGKERTDAWLKMTFCFTLSGASHWSAIYIALQG